MVPSSAVFSTPPDSSLSLTLIDERTGCPLASTREFVSPSREAGMSIGRFHSVFVSFKYLFLPYHIISRHPQRLKNFFYPVVMQSTRLVMFFSAICTLHSNLYLLRREKLLFLDSKGEICPLLRGSLHGRDLHHGRKLSADPFERGGNR